MVGRSFNDLPAEIRNMIYNFAKPDVAVLCLVDGQVAIRGREGLNVWKYATKSLTLLQLDRRSRAEATALLYEKCTFAISLRHNQSIGFPLLGNCILEAVSDQYQVLNSLHGVRNWVIELKWDTGAMGMPQSIAFSHLLKRVVDLLSHSRRLDSVRFHFGCLCSIQECGYGGLGITGSPPVQQKLNRSQAKMIMVYLLKPLIDLPVIKDAVFVPIKSVGLQDPHTGHCEGLCREETCLFDPRLIEEEWKRFLEGEMRSENA
ncbi:MAG: hypothetical protein Q9228_007574 [Teloschistes exilis]